VAGPAILYGMMTRKHLAWGHCLFWLLAIASGCSSHSYAGHCPGFQQCGGNIEGSWAISGSCVEGALTEAANINPKLPLACQGMYQAVAGTMSGTVTFNAGAAAIDTKMTITCQISADAACAATQGIASIDASNCVALGPALVFNQFHQSVTCTFADNRCKCWATDVFVTQESRTYTVAGASISYTGSDYPLDFCVDGTTLHGRQFDGNLVSTIFIDANRVP
jgi:hypothetical protein